MSTNDPGNLSPIERVRLISELRAVHNSFEAGGMNPIERLRASTQAIAMYRQLGGVVPEYAAPSVEEQAEAPAEAQGLELTGQEFGEFPDTQDGLKALRKKVKEWLQSIRGQWINCPALGGQVEMRKRGIKEAIANSAYPQKLKLLFALRQIIEGAESARRAPNTKPELKPDVEAYFYLDSVVQMGGESFALHVVIEQDQHGKLFYDLLIPPPPKEKALLDSSSASMSGVPLDNKSGIPLSPSQMIPNIDSGVRLEPTIEQQNGAVMLDEAGGLVLNLFMGHSPAVDDESEQATAEVAQATDPLTEELEAAKADLAKHERIINMGHVPPAAMAAIDRYSAASRAIDDRAEAQAWEAGKQREIGAANSKPHTVPASQVLTPAGAIKADAKNSKADSAIWYYQGDIQRLSFTASVKIDGQLSPFAEQAKTMLNCLKAAKAQGYRLRNYRAGSLGTVWVLQSADDKAFLTRAGFDEAANPVFARPDMPPEAPGWDSMVAQQTALARAFIGWLDTLPYDQRHNQGVVSRKIGSTAVGQWVRLESEPNGMVIQYRTPERRAGIRIMGADFEAAIMAARKLAVMPELEAAAEPDLAPAYPLFPKTPLFHGTALPFDHYTPSTRKGSGFDHQGQGFYLTTDKRGYAHFFALQAADRILNGPNEPKGEEARILESGGVILNVSLASGARVIDLTSPQASPELVAMVKNITDGNALRARVLADGYDGVAFVEPNHPEGFAVQAGAVTVVMYNADKAKIGGFEEAGKVAPLDLGESESTSGPLEITADTSDATIEAATDEQLSDKLLKVAKDFYRGLSIPSKDIARRLEKGVYVRADAVKALKENRDYLIERVRAGAAADADLMARIGRMFDDKPLSDAMAAYEAAGGEISALFNTREMNGGGRRTSAAVANEGARAWGQHKLELGIYIKTRQEREAAAHPVIVDPVPPAANDEPLGAHHLEVPAVPTPEIVEYTTKKGKVLRGIIRTDLTLEQAKAIDPYTWRMNGGYFIREKHLEGAPSVSYAQAAPAPVILTAEQQAEAAATAERQAAERRQQALANQVSKLRQVAEKAVAGGDEGLNRDRLTNTARRAGMAASSIAKAAADKAAGQTLSNLADAIENGAGGALASLTSRAQLEQLQKLMRSAQYESEKGLSYSEQQGRKGRPFDDNDLRHLVFPRPMGWSNWYRNAAVTLAKKSPTGNSRLIAALTKIGNGPERFVIDDEKDAITRKAYAALKAVKEGWDLATPMEMLAGRDRLVRMGITDGATLQTAVRELLPMMAEKVEEDPIKKAERAIIGQKVGIDFFPTPANVAQRMARLANIKQGTRVLEPSAGNGNLADAAAAAGGVVDVIEISSQLRDILTAKGYNVVATDFDDFTPEQPYRAILMNPPFSQRRDAAHIMRAYGMLAAGGTLVAIAGEGVFFGKDAKAVEFRDWLDAHNATVESLEGGTFTDKTLLAQTGANARLIVLEK